MGEIMSRDELIKKMQTAIEKKDKVKLSQDNIEKVLNGLFQVIEDAMIMDDLVPFYGIGKFETVIKGKRAGTNPITKEQIVIEETKYPHFKISRAFRQKVSQSQVEDTHD